MVQVSKKKAAIATTIMNGLFQALTAVSGSSSTEKSCTGTYAYLEIALNPFTPEKVG